MNIIKKQNVFGWAAIVSAVLSLVALIIYIASSATGYLAGQSINPLPIVLTILGIALLAAAVAGAGKADKRLIGIVLFAACVLLTVSLCVCINERVQLFADVYFIPVNYPAGEGSTLNFSIVGIVFYVVAILGTVVSGFGEQLNKAE